MAATINSKVATLQSFTPGAEFHGQASEKPADTVDALFDLSRTSFEPQDVPVSPIQPAHLPRLFRVKHLDRLGTSQTHHFGNTALGIRTEPLVRHALDFGDKRSTNSFRFQAAASRVLIAPTHTVAGNKLISFDVTTGAVSAISAETMTARAVVATHAGFALLWNGIQGAERGEYLTHIDAHTNKILWTKLLSDVPRTIGSYLHETAHGELVAMCSVGEYSRTDKFQLFRFVAHTGEQLGRTGDDAMVDFGGYKPQLSYDKKPVFFCDDTGQSIVLAAPDHFGKQRLVSVDFKDQATHSVCDLPFTWSSFENVAMRNGRVLILPKAGVKEGYDVTFRTLSDFNIEPITADIVTDSGSDLISNTNEDFAVKTDYQGALLFYQMTDNGFELVKTVIPPGVTQRGHQPLAMTDDNVVYYSAVTAKTEDQVECRLFAYDALTAEELWSIDKTFDAAASIAVNDDGSLSWFTASGGLILAAP